MCLAQDCDEVMASVMLPDGDVGPAPARAPRPRPGPVQVREVETGILVSLARGGGTLGLVHNLNTRSHTLVTSHCCLAVLCTHLPEPEGGVILQLAHHGDQRGVQVAGQLAVVPEQVDRVLVPQHLHVTRHAASG